MFLPMAHSSSFLDVSLSIYSKCSICSFLLHLFSLTARFRSACSLLERFTKADIVCLLTGHPHNSNSLLISEYVLPFLLNIKIRSFAYGGILLPDILDFVRIGDDQRMKIHVCVSSASCNSVIIIIYAYPVLNQVCAYHYAYIRFNILERSILPANIDIPCILI